MDKDGEPVKKEERVDAPMVNEALIGQLVAAGCVAGPVEEAALGCGGPALGGPGRVVTNRVPPRQRSPHTQQPPVPPALPALPAEWAQKVPVKQGGVLVKPEWSGETELPKEPRNDFQVSRGSMQSQARVVG